MNRNSNWGIFHSFNINQIPTVIIILIIQLLSLHILNVETKHKIISQSDFIFPNDRDGLAANNIVFHSNGNFIFPNDDDNSINDRKRPMMNFQNSMQNSGSSEEYNLCKKQYNRYKHHKGIRCGEFSNTNNGLWWKPKPENNSDLSPSGFSGFNPHHWKDHVHAYKKNGERERRKSELRFQKYIESIFGEGTYDENKILTVEELNGREIADPGEFPHVAAIGFRLSNIEKDWKCTGSLLSENFVLTAAHCTNFGGQAPNFVKLGDINLNAREEVVATQRFTIEEIFVHPDYTSILYYHDIALLKLSRNAVFTRHVHPIRIWPHRDIPFVKSFAMGYGATQFGRVPTGVLSYLNFTLIGNKECNKSLANTLETPYGIIDSEICAVNTINSADICQGDSGGPLQLHLPGENHPFYFLIGITSYGATCGSRLPSVYTRVYSYLQWIENIVWPD